MIPALTTAGVGNPGSFEELVKLAARHGFGGVDAGDLPAFLQRHGLEGALAFLREHRMVIGAFGLPVDWRSDEATFRHGLAQVGVHAAAAAALGCTRCTTWMMPSQTEPTAQWTATAIRRLRACAEVLGHFGIRLGLEPVAPHHLRTLYPHPFVWDFSGGLRICEGIDRPNVGLLVDSYHWFCSGGALEDLTSLPPEAIVHVHINDAPAGLPVQEQDDRGRLMPGEGVIDLKTFLSVLREKRYNGCVSLEVLTREPLSGTPDELAARAAAGMLPLF